MSTRDKSDFKQEDILQAVVIADSFNVRFAPLTDNRPRALLPLVNVPLLEYTLQFLCASGIQEAIVFCCSHAEKIKEFLTKSQWGKSGNPMKVTTVVSDGCMSLGDALRDLDNKSILKSDFVLVNGDLVGNVKLKPIIEEHKRRRQLSKGVVMTMVFKEAPPKHKSRCKEDDFIVAVEPKTQHVIAFQRQRSQKKFHIALDVNETTNDIKVYYNLLDCAISVCSPHMPQLLTDNFDYQTVDDFVRGVLGSEDILGNSIHLHVLKNEYALRASSLYMYQALSLDVLKRWSYPFVRDLSILNAAHGRLTYYTGNIYRHHNVKLAPNCLLTENVAIDEGSKVGSSTVISNSTIGANCIIGDNVQIRGCHIWNDVTIEDNAVLEDAVLDRKVRIGKGAVIKARCVLGEGVVIGPSVSLPSGTRLVAQRVDGLEPLEGNDGAAFRCRTVSSTDIEECEILDYPVWETQYEDDEDEEDDDEEDEMSMDGDIEDEEESESKAFEELMMNLDRAVDENILAKNLILEMNGIKCAFGVQIQVLTTMLMKAVLELPFRRLGSRQVEVKKYLETCFKFMKQFLPLLQNYIKDVSSEKIALQALEEFAAKNSGIVSSLPKVTKCLYDNDLLSEEGIMAWWKSVERPHGQELRTVMKTFVEWLENAEEESD